jgi:hypothetical protein
LKYIWNHEYKVNSKDAIYFFQSEIYRLHLFYLKNIRFSLFTIITLTLLCLINSIYSLFRRTPRRNTKVKQETEIQTYINEFNQEEIEEAEETVVGTSKETVDEIEQIIVKDGDVESDEVWFLLIFIKFIFDSYSLIFYFQYKFVFIVEDEEDADDKEDEVYEFDEIEELEDKDKLKPLSKKSSAQASSSQTHVCSYCNYSTPKRYLLARHMKCHSEDR